MAPPLSSNSPTSRSLRRQRKLRKWHRWLALVTAVQLLLWTLSGAYFAFVDINFVRGADHRVAPVPVALNLADVDWATEEGAELIVRHRLPGELVVGVVGTGATVWYTAAGSTLAELDAQEALQLAANATDLNPDSAILVDEDVVGSEYRGRPLPLWRVFNSERPSTVAYLDATLGEVVAHHGLRRPGHHWHGAAEAVLGTGGADCCHGYCPVHLPTEQVALTVPAVLQQSIQALSGRSKRPWGPRLAPHCRLEKAYR